MVVDDEGRHLMVIDGWDKPQLLKGRPKGGEYEAQYEREGLNTGSMMWSDRMERDDMLRMKAAAGRDPRAATGSGGAIINKAYGFVQGIMEPLSAILASGVFERFPALKFATVEADIGWIPWLLEALDMAYYKHHMWVRPYLSAPPSTYWYSNCYASVLEDTPGMYMAREFNMIDRIMWSNDYPHHEGTWPHSRAAAERQMGRFTEPEREKILGQTAAKLFGFDPVRLLALRASPPDMSKATAILS